MAMDLRNKFGFTVCLNEVWTCLAEITYLQEKATIFFKCWISLFTLPVHILKIEFLGSKLSARFHLLKVTPRLFGLLIIKSPKMTSTFKGVQQQKKSCTFLSRGRIEKTRLCRFAEWILSVSLLLNNSREQNIPLITIFFGNKTENLPTHYS